MSRTYRNPLALAFGIMSLCAAAHANYDPFAAPRTTDAPPTFSGEIAAIVYNNCTPCHHDGGGAPIPLTSYEQIAKRARMIAQVTGDRIMPPWKAAQGDVSFLNERHLSDDTIAVLSAWADAGAPLGDADAVPTAPVFDSKWTHGEPDLVLSMEEPFTIPASGPDIYRGFVVRIPELPEGTYLRGIEYRPKALLSAHHTLFSLDATGESRAMSEASKRPGFGGMESNLSLNRVGGWAVGSISNLYPEGVGVPLVPGTDLILSTHFHPGGKEEIEQAEIGLYLTQEIPTRHMVALDVPFGFGLLAGIRIPAGDPDYTIHEHFELPVDATLFGISPHAHYIAKSMHCEATLPDGTAMTIISVPRWDFAWQEQYRLKEPLPLPKGTKFDLTFVYDNSADNPANPHNPPMEITYGPQTTDEMACMTMAFLSDSEAAIDTLRQDYIAWVKEDIKHADLSVMVGAARQQRKEALDLNSDGHISLSEIWTRLSKARARMSRADADSLQMQLLPEIGKRIFLTVILPRLLPYIAVFVALLALGLYGLRRWLRAARKRKQERRAEEFAEAA
ncbi:MAG: hypothetical protein GC168_19725 [Candidatus Hydrogenedens sp.]|nr:hypothetical protein [Candidatus Hydrogenedens sp.]